MNAYFLTFPSEAKAKKVLSEYLTKYASEFAPAGQWITASHIHALDPVGVLYEPPVLDAAGEIVTPAQPLPGWHVNLQATELPAPALPFLVAPATPRQAFGLPAAAEPDQAALRAAKLSRVNALARAALALLVADMPRNEVDSWPVQVREAEALALDPQAPTPLLAQIAAARGLTVALLAERVREKTALTSLASGAVIGRRQALEDAVLAAPDRAALDLIDETAGWPRGLQ